MQAQANKICCYLQGIIKPVEFAHANTGPKFSEKKINFMAKPIGGRFFRPVTDARSKNLSTAPVASAIYL